MCQGGNHSKKVSFLLSLFISLFPLSIHISILCILSNILRQAHAIYNTLRALVLEADFMGLHGFEHCMSVDFPTAFISGIHTCIPICIHTHIHAYIHARMHAYLHACMHTCTHACLHTYIHTWFGLYFLIYLKIYLNNSNSQRRDCKWHV